MEIQGLLEDPFVRLPKTQPTGSEFREYVNELLSEYQKKAKQINFPNEINGKELLERLAKLSNLLCRSIKSYYYGSPFDAYCRLRDGINQSRLHEHWEGYTLTHQRNFYRLRIKSSNYHLSKEELFHIPFHLRRRVATQRFSIPGFPSLYLSNSIYTAWEEMRRPNVDQIQAVRFKNIAQLNLIDLTTARYSGKTNNDPKKLISDFLMWPLIACCSVKVKEPESYFKPEYIIPQLLLQVIRNRKFGHGIKFSSTHIDLNAVKAEGDFFNVVIPVQENKEKGYCSILSQMFEMTDVLSWQLHQFSAGGSGIVQSYNVTDGINPEIKKIEVVKNKPLPYEFSPLANLELALNAMKTHKLDFVLP